MNRRLLGVGDRVRCVKGSKAGTRGEVVRAFPEVLIVAEDGTDRVIRSGRDRWELDSSADDHTDQS